MTDIAKFATLLDDPEVRDLVFGLAHTRKPAELTRLADTPDGEPGAGRLRAIVLDLAVTTTSEQYRSWLDDNEHNQKMTTDQVRLTIGDGVLGDLADYASSTPAAVAWQLSEVLPDLVDAVSPGGRVVDTSLLAAEMAAATREDDLETGVFGN
ncbi:YidB family protein [Paractinoplanes globisporus]|uniref:YidB family protein n=1 Tax=Paractinoplanes globisporus TaxID=113565 RepID=A0ABW6W9V1_9ACTN|nr:YidB family protein [Actinoplanes globisporus]